MDINRSITCSDMSREESLPESLPQNPSRICSKDIYTSSDSSEDEEEEQFEESFTPNTVMDHNLAIIPFGINRYVVVTLYLMTIFFLQNFMWNWNPTRSALLTDNVYSWRCTAEDEVTTSGALCQAQDSAVNDLYVIATTAIYFSGVISGIANDYISIRVTMISGLVLHLCGLLCWLGGGASKDWLYPLGSALFGLANESLMIPFYSCAFLFPGRESLMIGILGGVRGAGFTKPVMLLAQTKTYSFQSAMLTWVIITCVCAVPSLLLLPKTPYQLVKVSEKKAPVQSIPKKTLLKGLLKECVKAKFIVFCLYLITNSFRSSMWSSLASYAIPVDSKAMTGLYWVSPLASILTPFLGFLADKITIIPVCCIITGASSIIFLSQAAAYNSVFSDWLCVMCSWVMWSFLSSQGYITFQLYFPFQHFGMLCAVSGAVQAIFVPISSVVYKAIDGRVEKVKLTMWFMFGLGVVGFLLLAICYRLFKSYNPKLSEKTSEEKNIDVSISQSARIAAAEDVIVSQD